MADINTPKIIVVQCPECIGLRAAEVLGDHAEESNEEHYWCRTSYKIVRCRGCSHVQFVTVYIDSIDIRQEYGPDGETVEEHVETVRHYPPLPERRRPTWMTIEAVGATVDHLLDEAYDALTHGLSVLAAIALRTVFDATTEALGIDPGSKFREKLDALANFGITPVQRTTLDALTDAGSAAAHRAWLPTDKELATMFDIMETFLQRVFVTMREEAALAQRAKALAQRTPPRPSKKATT